MISRMRWWIVFIGCLVLALGGNVLAQPLPQQGEPDLILIAARADLESLANVLMGDSARPTGWTNSFDVTVPSFAIELRLDLETLTGYLIAPDQRPAGWFGAVAGTSWSIARDIRHDLELLADSQMGLDQRPEIWISDDPLMRCDREVQSMVAWLQQSNPTFALNVTESGAGYCAMAKQQTTVFVETLITEPESESDLRADLNAFYAARLGTEAFPATWSGGADAASIRQDLTYLRDATAQVEAPITEEVWIGETFGLDWLVARANRHDLEVLADAKLGFGVRPAGWTYTGDAVVRCPLETQNLTALLRMDPSIVIDTTPVQPSFCQQVAVVTNSLVESRTAMIAANADRAAAASVGGESGVDPISVETGSGGSAVPMGGVASIAGQALAPNAYLDPSARNRLGLIPRGMSFTALARSSSEDSKMMYVQGETFALWVGWPWTTITEAEYLSLPYAEAVQTQLPQLTCFAGFCDYIVHNGNPLTGVGNVSGAPALDVPGENLQFIGVEGVRLYFDVDNIGEGWAEFRGELCTTINNSLTCESFLRIFEEGQVLPPVGSVNGQNVYRMTYRLNQGSRVETLNFYTTDLWVSHPDNKR